jgi:hypothetical protein
MNAGADAAIAAAIAQAVKASGAIVRIAPEGFQTLLTRIADPLVVVAMGGLFSKKYRYLMGYKGLVFFASSKEPLALPSGAVVVSVEKIWIPQ